MYITKQVLAKYLHFNNLHEAMLCILFVSD